MIVTDGVVEKSKLNTNVEFSPTSEISDLVIKKRPTVYNPAVHQLLYIRGRVFLQYNSRFCELVGRRTEEIVRIPDLDTDPGKGCYGKLFSIQDEIFATNGETLF